MNLRFRRSRAVPAAPGILAHYTGSSVWQRNRRKWLSALILFALFYGFFFGVTTTYFLLQLTIPLIILAGAVVWLLPETESVPVGLLRSLFFTFFGVLLLWPDYLAIALPGLPWITAVRLVGVPLTFVMLVCLSISTEMREALKETLAATPWILRLLVAFLVIAMLSIPVSTDAGFSTSKFIVAAINWFLIFFVACYVFRTPGRVTRFAYMLWVIAIVVSLIGIQEWRHSAVPWAGHVPGFLAVQDESVQRIMSGSARAATGIYRVQSKFTTSLGLAEFYALVMPFIIHFALTGSRPIVRVLAAVTIPFLFWMISLTDSRLGMVGFMLSGVLYLFVWGYWRWHRDQDSLIGPAVILGYPLIFTMFIASTFLVGRINNLVWGSGAQEASNEGRRLQMLASIPKVLERPWGYGLGRGGDTLGFTNQAGILTIDSYYLSIVLEFGLVGFAVYYAIFVNAIWNGVKRLPRTTGGETDLMAPLTIALVNFVVIKSILSQQDNHALVFAILGALVALCRRMDTLKEDRI